MTYFVTIYGWGSVDEEIVEIAQDRRHREDGATIISMTVTELEALAQARWEMGCLETPLERFLPTNPECIPYS